MLAAALPEVFLLAERIVHLEKQRVALESFTPEPLSTGQVRVQSLCSLMSTGTEGIIYNRLFEPGTHWDRWVTYPMYVGYATIGEVSETGDGVESLRVGQRVAVRRPHASQVVVGESDALPVPDAVDSSDAAWFALGKIAFHGARAAGFALGQNVALVGAGPLGQMATRWARAAGVGRLIVIDTVEPRLALARAGGASDVIALPVDRARHAVRELCGGRGPDVVLDVTGHPDVLATALGLPRRHGRVVLLGDTGTPSQQRLTSDVIVRGIEIVGVHDLHDTDHWNDRTISALFFDHVARGRIELEGLITHRFRPAEASDAFELTRHRRTETLGVLFDWTSDG